MVKSKPNNGERSAKKRLITLFLLIIFLFFLSNLFFRFPGFVKRITQPFPTQEASFANSHRLDLSSRSSLLVLNTNKDGQLKQAWVATYEPGGKQITFVSIPVEISIAIKLDRPLNLKDLKAEGFDRAFWESALLVGSDLDGYLIFDEAEIVKDSVLSVRKEALSLGYFLSILEQKGWLDDHLRTNLTLSNLFSATRVLKGVNTEAINFIDLSDSVVSGQFDTEKLANQTRPIFLDSEIADEAASVKIINGTNADGLGANFKRLVTNLGGRVLTVDTEKASKTSVVATEGKKKLAEKVADFLDIEITKQEEGSDADVVITLGNDLAERLDLN